MRVTLTSSTLAVPLCVTALLASSDQQSPAAPDTSPPGLVYAIALSNRPQHEIHVRFTEMLRSSTATNPADYSLRLAGTDLQVPVSRALPFFNSVILAVGSSNWFWGSNYVLTVRNVTDLQTNEISPLTNRVSVGFPRVVLPFDSVSRGWNAFEAQRTGRILPPDWAQPEFPDDDPVMWPAGRGIIHHGSLATVEPECGTLGDNLMLWPTLGGGEAVYYFRTRFTMPANLSSRCLSFLYPVNDANSQGAVFYLNGLELHRFQVPMPPVIWEMPFICAGRGWMPQPNLRPGENVLAAEIHQAANGFGGGVVYGVQVSEVISGPLPPLPALSIRAPEPGCSDSTTSPCVVTVTWPAEELPGWVLEGTTNLLAGPWTTVATNSPHAARLTAGSPAFFRLSGPE